MLPDRALQLLTKQLTASLNAEEQAELQAWLSDPENAAAAALLQKFWQRKKEAQAPDVEAALQKTLAAINESEEPALAPVPTLSAPPRKRWWLAAAAVAVVAGLSFFALRTTNSINKPVAVAAAPATTNGWVDKQNAKGTRSLITLADGSKVWLNADSRLQYPATFNGATREVSLVGEAFFDVARNPQKPFIIHLENGTVRVLGTSFNIKAYPGDRAVETSVSTGRVAFIPKTKNKATADTTFLTRNKKAVFRLADERVTTTASEKEDKAWIEGKLMFDAERMQDIAVELERYFGKPVVILDEEIKAYRLTGSFANNTVEEILYYLSKTKPFTYRITDTQILLSLVH